ncbi:MAG: fibrinogen-like YCDxxxxGGGW domain-containing protein [Sulfurimonadaceae bacterium]|jgi:hypothetical protein|nr:fibrinogen-like YCDxxxxGGGW domain-containing protein [Sulfurimonadaceae bacterium]
MLKVLSISLIAFVLVSGSDYTRANSASKEALQGLDCDFDDCPKPEPKVIIQERIVEKPVEKIIIQERIVEKPVEKIIIQERVVEKPVYIEREATPRADAVQIDGLYGSCQEIKEVQPNSRSGYFDISVGGKKINVYCEMIIAGGGWTRVWQAEHDNYHETQFDYELPYGFVEATVYTMIAYDNNNRLLSPYHFKTPHEWKVQHPMSYNRGTSTIEAFDAYTNRSYRNRKLMYGFENFSSQCGDGFSSGDWGKLCITSTQAPFFASFNHSQKDFCNTSDQSYNTTVCKEARFSIFMK